MFKRIEDASDSPTQVLSWMIRGIQAVDLENRLCLTTTRGYSKGAEKWFVHRLLGDNRVMPGALVVFRAWDLDVAIDKANTNTRIVKRIQKGIKA